MKLYETCNQFVNSYEIWHTNGVASIVSISESEGEHSNMTAIRFQMTWDTPEKTRLRLTAQSGWTWKDYHAVSQVVIYAMPPISNSVLLVLDFTAVNGERFPSGIRAHSRTFGKRLSPSWSGVTVVIGLPAEQRQQVRFDQADSFSTADGVVYAVEDEAQAQTLFTRLAEV